MKIILSITNNMLTKNTFGKCLKTGISQVTGLVLLCGLAIFLSACSTTKKIVENTLTVTQLQYDYHSISGLTLAGVNIQNVKSISSLNPLDAAGLLTAITTNASLPLQFTLNLEVKNPSNQAASLSDLQYILEIDNIQMTEGMLNQPLQVAGHGSAILPVYMSFDLRTALSGQSAEVVKNLALNFTGSGNAPSTITIRLKPSMDIGGKKIVSPVFIPVSFTYGKGNK
jgi:LEA14-like dessication related protein